MILTPTAIKLIIISECKYVMGIFFDIKGDNLWPQVLMEEVRKLNIHPKFLQLIRHFFINRSIEAEAADFAMTKIPTKECPQGSNLGPIFWDIALQPCLEKLNTIHEVECEVGYTADQAVVLKENS